jgi:hypothetical protein
MHEDKGLGHEDHGYRGIEILGQHRGQAERDAGEESEIPDYEIGPGRIFGSWHEAVGIDINTRK